MASLIGLSLFLAFALKIRTELTIFVSVSGVITIVFFFGLLGLLVPALWVTWTFGVVLGLIALYRIVRVKDTGHLTPGLLFFIFACCAHYLLTRNGAFRQWDEFSHWGTIIKQISEVGSLYRNQNLYFQDYPPGVAIFADFMQMPGPFTEANALFAGGVIVLAGATALTTGIDWKRFYLAPIILGIVYFCSFIFGKGLATVLIDYILGSFFGAILALYIFESRIAPTRAVVLCLAPISSLVLLKAAGTGLAFAASVLIATDQIIVRKRASFSKEAYGGLLIVAPFIAVFATQGAWRFIMHLAGYPNRAASFDGLLPLRILFDPQLDPEKSAILWTFIRALEGTVPVVPSGHGLPVVLLLISTLMVLAIVGARASEGYSRILASAIVIYLGLAFYLYGLLAAYMTSIADYEAKQILSFDRFVSVYLAGMVPPVVALMRLYIRDGILGLVLSAALGVCILVAPTESIRYFRKGSWPITDERRALVARVQPAIAKIPHGAKVYVIWQNSNGLEFWQVRYELGSRPVNQFCWSISVARDDADMYKCTISPAKLRDELKNYQYLLVANGDDKFAAEYLTPFNHNGFEGAALYQIQTCAVGSCLSRVP